MYLWGQCHYFTGSCVYCLAHGYAQRLGAELGHWQGLELEGLSVEIALDSGPSQSVRLVNPGQTGPMEEALGASWPHFSHPQSFRNT